MKSVTNLKLLGCQRIRGWGIWIMYTIETYKDNKRFNEQYEEIHQFLLKVADKGYNEHFHWARFEWMMDHSFLDEDKLTTIAVFRNHANDIVGMTTYDTVYDDRTYLIHSNLDINLLKMMVEYVIKNDSTSCIKINSMDDFLKEILKEYSFSLKKDESVLEFDLKKSIEYEVPSGFAISSVDFNIDNWKYQLVIHKGFNHEGIPEKWDDDFLKPSLNCNNKLKVFAMNSEEYCAHCGIWYTQGDTAYIEPVVTIPQYRKIGLAKAVVYEALARVKELGAKRAIVLSDQEFYYKIGFEKSSTFGSWYY